MLSTQYSDSETFQESENLPSSSSCSMPVSIYRFHKNTALSVFCQQQAESSNIFSNRTPRGYRNRLGSILVQISPFNSASSVIKYSDKALNQNMVITFLFSDRTEGFELVWEECLIHEEAICRIPLT